MSVTCLPQASYLIRGATGGEDGAPSPPCYPDQAPGAASPPPVGPTARVPVWGRLGKQ